MTLWRNSLSHTQALGIFVSADQVDALENGGEVLVIQGLPAPGCLYEYDQMITARDLDDDPVMVASIIKAIPVNESAPSSFNRPPGVVSFLDLVEQNHSPHWRYWPSYTGEMSEYCNVAYEWYCEAMQVYRIWSGIPTAVIGHDVAVRIVDACNQRVEGSAWQVLDTFIGNACENGIPETPEENPDVEYDEYDLDILATIKMLEADGLWDSEYGCYTGNHLAYHSMESLLDGSNPLDEPALEAWNFLVQQSRIGAVKALETQPDSKQSLYVMYEKDYEPWL